MVGQGDRSDTSALPPDEGFEVLGNETRMEILRALGEAGGPLQFSELRERVGVRDSGQFNYHLERVVGQFVRKGEDGYALRQAGRRVVEVILSGAVTETPVVEPTRIDHPCHYCGSPIGRCRRPSRPPGPGRTSSSRRRRAASVRGARRRWRSRSRSARGTTPATASVIGVTAGTRSSFTRRVQNCINDLRGPLVLRLVADTELLSFLLDHGLDPIARSGEGIYGIDRIHMDDEEEVVSTGPFDARFTFTADGEALTLAVDDDLSVIDATRESR
jgi:hypothetical protein